MSIVRPSATIEQRWHGALQTSIRQAPLELFLRTRALEVTSQTSSRHSDNVARATLYFLRAGVDEYCSNSNHVFDADHYSFIGRIACSISKTLANLIEQPTCSRAAALRSVAQLLSLQMKVNDAACTSASVCREFADLQLGSATSIEQALCDHAEAAVLLNEELSVRQLALATAAELALITPACISKNIITLPTRAKHKFAQR
jgi:hypothetical protein